MCTSAAAWALLAVAAVTLVAWPGRGHAGIVYSASSSASFNTADALAGHVLDQPDLTAYFRADATDDQLAAFFGDEFEGGHHLWHFEVGMNFISRKLQIRFTPRAPLDERIEIRTVLATSPLVDHLASPE